MPVRPRTTRRAAIRALAALPWLLHRGGAGAAPACAQAANATRPLTAVTMALAPWGVSPPGAPPRGIFVEVMASIAAAGKLCIDNIVVPYSRGLAMISTGEADLVISFKNTLLQRISVPIGMGVGDDVVVVGPPAATFRALADLRGKLVASVRGVEYDGFSDDAQIRKVPANGVDQCLKMLAAGRVDAVIGSRTALDYAVRQLRLPPSALAPALVVGHQEFFLHYSKHSYDPVMAQILRASFADLQRSGALAELARHLPER